MIDPQVLFHALVESVEDVVCVLDREGRFASCNARGLEKYAMSREHVIGRLPEEVLSEELGKRFQEHVQQVLRSEKPLNIQEWIPLRGEPRHFQIILTPLSDAQGAFQGILGVGREDTECIRLRERESVLPSRVQHLSLEKEKLEQCIRDAIQESMIFQGVDVFLEKIVAILGRHLDVSRIVFYEYDRIHKVVNCTHEWCAPSIESNKEQMQGIPLAAQPWLSGEMFAGRVVSISDSSKLAVDELKAFLQSIGVQALLALPLFVFGDPFGFIGYSETTRHREWRQVEIESLTAVGQIICQKIERQRLSEEIMGSCRIAAIGHIAASLMHEINNPLQAVLLNLEALEGHTDQVGEKKLGLALQGFQRVAGIVTKLSKMTHSMKDVVEIEINEILKESFALIAREMDLRDIDIQWQLDMNLPNVRGDRRKLQQAFLNIFLNARDSIQNQGRISISSTKKDEAIVVEIQDTGCGIKEENLPYVFEPFFTTKGVSQAGLGLYVTHAIIHDHTGRIDVKSKEGSGTTVRVYLPFSHIS